MILMLCIWQLSALGSAIVQQEPFDSEDALCVRLPLLMSCIHRLTCHATLQSLTALQTWPNAWGNSTWSKRSYDTEWSERQDPRIYPARSNGRECLVSKGLDKSTETHWPEKHAKILALGWLLLKVQLQKGSRGRQAWPILPILRKEYSGPGRDCNRMIQQLYLWHQRLSHFKDTKRSLLLICNTLKLYHI